MQSGCAAGDPSSGTQALGNAGFGITRVQNQPGFVCRINGQPASDPCVRTPPATAYWSYWHAQPGGSWTYSASGGGSRNPAPGTVDGWSFGAGSPPGIAPPPASAQPPPAPPAPPPPPPQPQPQPPAPAPGPTAGQPRPTSAAPGDPGGPGAPGATSAPGGAGSPDPSAAPGDPAATTTGDGSSSAGSPASGDSTSSSDTTAGATATDVPATGGGFPWALVVGGLAIAALGTGAFVVSRRRATDT